MRGEQGEGRAGRNNELMLVTSDKYCEGVCVCVLLDLPPGKSEKGDRNSVYVKEKRKLIEISIKLIAV